MTDRSSGGSDPRSSASADTGDTLLGRAVAGWEPELVRLRNALMPGETLAERFVIEALKGAGGMGRIHRARDLHGRSPVAIKVQVSERRGDAERFAREAAVLATLSHPCIVRYITHGTTSHAVPFLGLSSRVSGWAIRNGRAERA